VSYDQQHATPLLLHLFRVALVSRRDDVEREQRAVHAIEERAGVKLVRERT
jgi:hypothetical protein